MADSHPILVISTNPADRFQLREAFSNYGIVSRHLYTEVDSVVANYLDNFLEHFLAPPKLVLLNLDIAYQASLSILACIKQHPLTQTVPVITYGQHSAQTVVKLAYEQGASAYLVKPANWSVLVSTILNNWGHWSLLPGVQTLN
ncbi:hypothetical protein GCM10023189_40730 [Nibrella saemangeumensis]|uniref:Response regulatory domain-containing protein n=1 Tax=Nibrella saemangeumensis TaxID=1084526 RepID=A0ABP8NCP6_9BACT